MARLTAHLIRNVDPHRGARGRPARVLAAVTVLALILGSISPGWALALEAESEGEGGGTNLPGLGNPTLEPGGPETTLQGVPGSGGGEEGEEGAEDAPVETEPAQEPAVPEATPGLEEPPTSPEPAPPVAGPAPATPPAVTTPAQPGPEYAPSPTPAPPAPQYETAPPANAQPVENEALVAPQNPNGTTVGHVGRKSGSHHEAAAPSSEEPAAPAQPTSAPPPPNASLPPEETSTGSGRIPAGSPSYTVRPGDCLWTIAVDLLPPGSDNARIVAEVEKLWRLNADRIGTGDPNLIYSGTELRLR